MKIIRLFLFLFTITSVIAVQAQPREQKSGVQAVADGELGYQVQELLEQHIFGPVAREYVSPFRFPGEYISVDPGHNLKLDDPEVLKKELENLAYIKGSSGNVKVVRLLQLPGRGEKSEDELLLAVVMIGEFMPHNQRSIFDAMGKFDKNAPIAQVWGDDEVLGLKIDPKADKSQYAILPIIKTPAMLKICSAK